MAARYSWCATYRKYEVSQCGQFTVQFVYPLLQFVSVVNSKYCVSCMQKLKYKQFILQVQCITMFFFFT